MSKVAGKLKCNIDLKKFGEVARVTRWVDSSNFVNSDYLGCCTRFYNHQLKHMLLALVKLSPKFS